jgi:hypothetical protein
MWSEGKGRREVVREGVKRILKISQYSSRSILVFWFCE